MTNEDKELLLKDLCARLPHGVKISIPELWISEKKIEVLNEIFKGDDDLYRVNDNGMLIEYIKPYLFPLSSMTEEQKEEYCRLQQKVIYNSKGPVNSDVMEYVNWCYKNHIDINNLIPIGLANDATGLNIY